MKKLLLVIVVGLVLAGCAWRRQIDRGTLAATPLDFTKSYEVDRTKMVESADRAHGVWLIPLGSPDAQVAVEKAINEANKTSKRKVVALADVNVDFKFLWLYFYSQRWYQVTGHPIYESMNQ